VVDMSHVMGGAEAAMHVIMVGRVFIRRPEYLLLVVVCIALFYFRVHQKVVICQRNDCLWQDGEK